ncbi:D-amino-acid transaminase [Brevibacillus ginsengisoli]|uniref:D-amino-acid transaminase n=1 Tax=Brevibacillus ginsengisoli TaxID=363854 RepID=UPI003CF44F7C
MYYVNGTWCEHDIPAIQPEDRGYQFGDGIYEVVRIYRGKLFLWEEHLSRLVRSSKELSLTLPHSPDELMSIVHMLISKSSLGERDDAILYLQITRGVAPRQFEFPTVDTKPTITAYVSKKARPLSQFQRGIKAITANDIRWLRCDIKSLNLLGAVMAKQQAKEQGADDAIMHRDGIVTEGSSSNVFVVKDGTLYTHPETNLILHGITRKTVLQLAATLQIPVQETAFNLEFLRAADEVFITATTSEITPVVLLDGQPVANGEAGSVVKQLQFAYTQYVQSVCGTFV